MGKTILRHKIADFLDIGKPEKAEFVLMGIGFRSLDENMGAQTESSKYICEATESSSVTSYKTTFPFEAEHIADEKAIDALYKVGRNHLTGNDTEFDYVRVELWNPATPVVADEYTARKFRVSAEISEYTGEHKQLLSGNLNAVGDPILGKFNTKTKVFTPDAAPALAVAAASAKQ